MKAERNTGLLLGVAIVFAWLFLICLLRACNSM